MISGVRERVGEVRWVGDYCSISFIVNSAVTSHASRSAQNRRNVTQITQILVKCENLKK